MKVDQLQSIFRPLFALQWKHETKEKDRDHDAAQRSVK